MTTPLAYLGLYAIDDYGGAAVEHDIKASWATYDPGVSGASLVNATSIHLLGYHIVANSGTCRVGVRFRLASNEAGKAVIVNEGVTLLMLRILA
jgi:hypothetical protein